MDMNSLSVETLPPTARASVIENQIDGLERQIVELGRTANGLRTRRLSIVCEIGIAHLQRCYLRVAEFLRDRATSVFGWRWAVALVGATASGGIFAITSASLGAGLIGLAIGALVFIPLLTLPKDSDVIRMCLALENRLKDRIDQRAAIRETRNRLANELKSVKNRKQELAGELMRIRESHRYKLDQLALRNWKAMRGGDLEVFLAEVFIELQYIVERTGRAGDQGVDLILRREARRIAVQVKGYVDSVPNTAIQEAYTGMRFHRCDACAVITNSRFTSGGRSVAASVGCALVDETTLPMLIRGQIDLWSEILRAKLVG